MRTAPIKRRVASILTNLLTKRRSIVDFRREGKGAVEEGPRVRAKASVRERLVPFSMMLPMKTQVVMAMTGLLTLML